MKGEVVKFPPEGKRRTPTSGSAGLCTQVPGGMATVSNLASATGGIAPANSYRPITSNIIHKLKNYKTWTEKPYK